LLAGVANTYPCPGFGVGGIGSRTTTVRSCPVLPPRGPVISYNPEFGAGVPGLKGFFGIAYSPFPKVVAFDCAGFT